jgi:transcriptional regulator with XRE-family HTH domain
MYVGNRVRLQRMKLGMSQSKLGDALGVTFQQVQKYEKGANRISASRLQDVSRILQVTVTYFFEGGPSHVKVKDSSPSTYVFEFASTSEGLALAKAFTEIKNGKLRHQIVKFVTEIVGD